MSFLSKINQFSGYPVSDDSNSLLLIRAWSDNQCRWRLDNISAQDIHVKEIVLFEGLLDFPLDTALYGDGFQMLAQTKGTIEAPVDIGRCPDVEHYQITGEAGFQSFFNTLLISKNDGQHILLGFSASHKFSGSFRLSSKGYLKVVVDCENLSIDAMKYWQGDPLIVLEGESKADLFDQYAQALLQNHSPRNARVFSQPAPTGWCSWYHYYADISEQAIKENAQKMQSDFPYLEHLLIDDGYQAKMGDWLSPSERFSSGLEGIVDYIHKKGVKPALWLAPFIAEETSQIFKEHPDWFVKNKAGKPLAAKEVTYGGWRCTPWYCLDGTHPEVQQHFIKLMSYLHNDLGIGFFKLDANFWGAIHNGYFFDKKATRIEAYRQGMKAIGQGAGNSFLLGCNAPMWPSLGLVDGMRIGDDVERDGKRFQQIAQEIVHRSWQNNRLWINDPDCITLENLAEQIATESEYKLHLATLLVCNGLMISSDRLSTLSIKSKSLLNKLLNNSFSNKEVTFLDDDYSHAKIVTNSQILHLFFNWEKEAKRFELPKKEGDQLGSFFDEFPVNIEEKENSYSIHVEASSAEIIVRSK